MFWKETTRLKEMPVSSRVAITGFLIVCGIGYLLGFFNIYVTYALVDEQPGMSMNDIAYSFYGKREATKLEKSVDGSMRQYFQSDADYQATKDWLAGGATEAVWDGSIKPIFDTSCSTCHSEAAKVADVVTETYEAVSAYLVQDTGKTIPRLISISHTHVLGTAPILFLLAVVFAFTSYSDRFKTIVMGFAFFAILFDVGSWWLAKLAAGLAVLVTLGGISLALSFAVMILLSLYELWLKKD
jgi:hypothetical protein